METIQHTKRKNISKVMFEREQFILIGLTGRIGSGCSEVADILCSDYEKLGLPTITPGDCGFADNTQRDRRILVNYAKNHWLPFDLIRSRTIIATYLLNDMENFMLEVGRIKQKLGTQNKSGCRIETTPESKASLEFSEQSNIDSMYVKKELRVLEQIIITRLETAAQSARQSIKDYTSYLESNMPAFNDWALSYREKFAPMVAENKIQIEIVSGIFKDFFSKLYKSQLEKTDYSEKHALIASSDKILRLLSSIVAPSLAIDNENGVEWSKLININTSLEKDKQLEIGFQHFVFVHDVMPVVADAIRDYLVAIDATVYTALFQKYGNSLRRYGQVIFNDSTISPDPSITPQLFTLSRKANQFIKVLRHPFERSSSRPTRIVIDSIKNVFEVTYLRERYSAFYLFAISTVEADRLRRLTQDEVKKMNILDIHCADWSEYSSEGYEIYKTYMKESKRLDFNCETTTLSPTEIEFAERVLGKSGIIHDLVREEAYEKGLHSFVLQDVESSIEDADVFISNCHDTKHTNALCWEIVKYVCLIQYPGLLLPTPIERCMQIAFSAKANSGCLSRQVGAVVTDSEFNILSIGWNDVPCGDITCARKNIIDLCHFEDSQAYTAYELTHPGFRKRLERYLFTETENSKLLCGLPARYCFKDLHIDEKNPMRSRAMHAEEKALSTSKGNCSGGYLFTTSSPCEMCSKNAKNNKIKAIYYIQPYPGISEEQYTKSGDSDNIAMHVLFTGAVGRAYTQMYTPIMPHKDILAYMGFPKSLKSN